MNALKEKVDFMLELFVEAAKELRVEERLDEIINQNKVIIGKLASLQSTAIFTEKQKSPEPNFNLQKPNFQPAPQPRFQQPPGFQQSFIEPNPQELDELPELKELDQPPRPYQQGPVAMPSISFSSFNEPKKKGLFGRLKQ